MIYLINPASIWTNLGLPHFCNFVVTKYILNSIQLKSIENATVLSVTFCPYHFV